MDFLVQAALRGAKKIAARFHAPPRQAPAATLDELLQARGRVRLYEFDHALFWCILTTGLFGLFRLGELVSTDHAQRLLRGDTSFTRTSFIMRLRYSKTDMYYRGESVPIAALSGGLAPLCPVHAISVYLTLRDLRFPHRPELFIREDGHVPTREWVVTCLRRFVGPYLMGHSLRATGATLLAQSGASQLAIMRAGRWTSDTFLRYLRDHPAVNRALTVATPELEGASALHQPEVPPRVSGIHRLSLLGDHGAGHG